MSIINRREATGRVVIKDVPGLLKMYGRILLDRGEFNT